MRRLEKASKPKSNASQILVPKLVYYVLIPLVNTLCNRLGLIKLIQVFMEIELTLNSNNTHYKNYKDDKKPLRIKTE